MTLKEQAEPGDGAWINHGRRHDSRGKPEFVHSFRRIAGAWYCSCDRKTPWAWPNVVAYVAKRGPVQLLDPPATAKEPAA